MSPSTFERQGFVERLRQLKVTPHIARKVNSRTLDGRTTSHLGYAISQHVRKRIEEVFGRTRTVGGMRSLHHRRGARVNWRFLFAPAAHNLVRMRTLQGSPEPARRPAPLRPIARADCPMRCGLASP